MDDVLSHVVLAVGDEALRPGEPIGAIFLRVCLGCDDAKVGPGVGLGKAHRARPLPRCEIRGEIVYQILPAMFHEHFVDSD